MKKYQHTLTCLILSVIAIFTLYAYLKNQMRDTENILSEKVDAYDRLQSHFLKHVKMLSGCLKPETSLYSINASDSTISDLSKKGSRLVLYIDRSQCEQCWIRALEFLMKSAQDISYMPEPIILASGYNRRDFQLMLNRNKINCPIYLIDRPWEIEPLLVTNQPFYFILEKDGFMSYIIYPEDMYDLIGESYLNLAAKLCYPDSTVASQSTSDIVLLNPEIDLGEVPLRKKLIVKLGIRNNGNGKRIITGVQAACNCILVEDYPTAIFPGETETIKVTFLSSNTGIIQRKVMLFVEGEKTPYIFKIKGEVI